MPSEKNNLSTTNYAFIDSQNVNLGVRDLGWRLDFARFRVYLKEKYNVSRAYLFIGYIPENVHLYAELQAMGYICIFKPTVLHIDGKVKGNCDAELVMQAIIDRDEYRKAIIATGDGDFFCLVNYLLKNDQLEAVLIPNREKFSALLKMKNFRPSLRYMNDLKKKLAQAPPVEVQIKEGPHEDKTS